MLRWLPSALYSKSTERQHFMQDILLFVFGVHVLFLLVMVGASMFGNKLDSYSISMHQTGATYVLMPLQKKVDQLNNHASRSVGTVNKKSQVVNYEDYQRRKKLKKRIPKKAVKSTKVVATSKARSSLQKIMQQDRATAAWVGDRKHSVGRSNKIEFASKKGKKNKKKNKVKMVEAVVTTRPEHVSEESLIIPEAIVPAVPEVAVQETIETAPTAVDAGSTESLDAQYEGKDWLEPFDTDNVVFVGYQQLDECVVGSKIQHSIQQCWTPPIGISSGTSCQMRVTVSDQGVASAVKIETGSGVLVYDTSARTALLQVEYPKEVWNKTITIVLGN